MEALDNSKARLTDDSDFREGSLRPSMRMLQAFDRVGEDDIDFFADEHSPLSSARKFDRRQREVESPRSGQFSKREVKNRPSIQEISNSESLEAIYDLKNQLLANTMATTMDKSEPVFRGKDSPSEEWGPSKVQHQWQSPESSYSSHNLIEGDRIRNLGKIREVSFENSSARPSHKTSHQPPTLDLKEEITGLNFKCMPVPTFKKAKKPTVLGIHNLSASKPRVDINMDKLKRKYLNRNSILMESSKQSPSKSSKFNQIDSSSNMNSNPDISMNKKSTISKSVRQPIKSKYGVFLKTECNSLKSQDRKGKKFKSMMKIFGSQSCPRSTKTSDASETFSCTSINDPGARKSTNLSNLHGAFSPKGEQSREAKPGFVKVRDKLREHTFAQSSKFQTRTPIKPCKLVERKTCPEAMAGLKKSSVTRKDAIEQASNVFRDLFMSKNSPPVTPANQKFDKPADGRRRARGSMGLMR